MKSNNKFFQYIKDGEKVNREDENFYTDYLRYIEDKKQIDCDVYRCKNEQYKALGQKYDVRTLERFRHRQSESSGVTSMSGIIGGVFLIPVLISMFFYVDGPMAGLERILSDRFLALILLVGLDYTVAFIYNIIRNIRVSKKIKEAKKQLERLE